MILIIPLSVNGLIILGKDNNSNKSPQNSNQVDIFNSVAKLCYVTIDGNTGGQIGVNTSGSAIHLKGKYFLTANHVQSRSHLTFNDVSFFQIDS